MGRIIPQGQGTITYLDGHKWAGYRYEGDFSAMAMAILTVRGSGTATAKASGSLSTKGSVSRANITAKDDNVSGRRSGWLPLRGRIHRRLPSRSGKWYRDCEAVEREYEGECQQGEYHGQGTLYGPDGTIQRKAVGEPIDENAAP